MKENAVSKPRRGRPPLKEGADYVQRLSIGLPTSYVEEIAFDMQARGTETRSEKFREIVEYWFDNCPDRVENKIPRKKRATGDYKLGR